MKDKKQIVIELPDDPFAEASKFDDTRADNRIERRVDRSKKKRCRQTDALENARNDPRSKRCEIQLDVRQLRHRTRLTRTRPLRQDPCRRNLAASHRLIDVLHGTECVGLRGGLVWAIAFHSCKPQRQPAGILRAFLQIVEGNLHNELRPNEDDVAVAAYIPLEERACLPLEQLVCETLEPFAQHHESAALFVASAEMQLAEPPASPAIPPLRSQHHEVERPGELDLQP